MLTRRTSRFISTVEKLRRSKYWLDRKDFDVTEAFNYRMNGKDKREVKRIIFEHFEYIESEWDEFQGKK